MVVNADQQVSNPPVTEILTLAKGGLLETMGHDELLTRDFSEPSIVSGGILSSGRSLLVVGAPKTGKTILALNLALALAQGASWLGFEIPEPQRVLFLSGEGGPGLLQVRLRKMIDPAVHVRGSLKFWWYGDEPLLLEDPKAQAQIIATIEKLNISVIIIDPLIRFHALDENSTTDMAAIVSALGNVRHKTKAAIVIVHHTRKPGTGSRQGSVHEARGSSVLHADIDAAMVLNQRRKSGDFTVNFELRWAAEPPGMKLLLDQDRLHFLIAGELSSSTRESCVGELLKALKEGGEFSSASLAKKVGVSNRTVQRHLNDLEESDQVTSRPGPNKTKFWSIPEEKDGVPYDDERDNA